MKARSFRSLLWIALAAAAAASMWFYTVSIWSANQPPRFSDLYASWWATHELFLHARNPYSPQVIHEIQTVIYGAPYPADDPTGIGGGFAYPAYTTFFFWPAIYMSYSSAQKVFLCVSLIATLFSIWLWLRTLRFRVTLPILIVISLLTFGSFPASQGFKLQNPSLIAATFVALTFFLLSTNRLIFAGIALAASTFKPQFVILLILWLALWTFGNWRQRRALAWSFLATMFFLILMSEWLVPGWISQFLYIIRAYGRYTYGHSLLDVWFTSTWGPFFDLVLAASVLAFCWPQRSQTADSPQFSLAASFVLAATLVVIPTLAPHAQLLLLPAFLCLMRDRRFWQRSNPQSGAVTRISAVASWFLLAWPWMAALTLFISSFWIPTPALLRFWLLPLYTSPVLPLIAFIAVACLLRARSKAPAANLLSQSPSSSNFVS
jgi:hypothetical protein